MTDMSKSLTQIVVSSVVSVDPFDVIAVVGSRGTLTASNSSI